MISPLSTFVPHLKGQHRTRTKQQFQETTEKIPSLEVGLEGHCHPKPYVRLFTTTTPVSFIQPTGTIT